MYLRALVPRDPVARSGTGMVTVTLDGRTAYAARLAAPGHALHRLTGPDDEPAEAVGRPDGSRSFRLPDLVDLTPIADLTTRAPEASPL